MLSMTLPNKNGRGGADLYAIAGGDRVDAAKDTADGCSARSAADARR